jgi:hypothetical protein
MVRWTAVLCLILLGVFGSPLNGFSQSQLPDTYVVSDILGAVDISATGYVGYFSHTLRFGSEWNNAFAGESFGTTLFRYTGSEIKYPITGTALMGNVELWFKRNLFSSLPRLGLITSLWYLAPSGESRADQTFDRTIGFPISDLPQNGSWDVKTNWWWIESFLSAQIIPGLEILGGFRYESFYSRFRRPDLLTSSSVEPFPLFLIPVPAFHVPQDEGESKAGTTMPLVGARLKLEMNSGYFACTVFGWPWLDKGAKLYHTENQGGLPITIDASATPKSGSYFVFMVEAKQRFRDQLQIGGLVRWDLLECKTDENIGNYVFNSVWLDAPAVGGGGSSGSIRRGGYTIGLSASFDL